MFLLNVEVEAEKREMLLLMMISVSSEERGEKKFFSYFYSLEFFWAADSF